MADIGEVSTQVDQALNPDRINSIARALAYADVQITHLQENLETLLDGSQNRHARELQSLLGKIAAGIGEVGGILPTLSEEKDALLGDWTGSSPTLQPTETSNVIIIPQRPDTVTEQGPMFDTKRNYFDHATQARLDVNLTEVITAEKIGESSAHTILLELARRGMASVRDLLSSGSDAVASNLEPGQLQDLHRVLDRHCPGMPLRKTLTTTEIARFNKTVEHLPVQAILPDYAHPQGRRVTIGQVYDLRLRSLKKAAREHFAGSLPRYEEELRAFLNSFYQAQRRLEKHQRGGQSA